MNFRSTAILFGLLLGMLWLFGLMVALKKTGVDEALVLPSLQARADRKIDVDTVIVRRRQSDKTMKEYTLIKDKSEWKLQVPALKGKVTVDAGKVNELINQVRNARRDEDAEVPEKPGLEQPEIEVILEGHKEIKPEGDQREKWTLALGQTSADNAYVFVTSSDQKKNKVLAVERSKLRSLYVDDPNKLRSLDPLGIFDAGSIKAVDLKQAPDGAAEVELKQFEDGSWRFAKPALGYADSEGPAPAKDIPGIEPKEGGVKGLLAAIKSLRINAEEDFLPLREVNLAAHGLEPDKERLRIEVSVSEDKEQAKKTLLVGIAVKEKGKEQYYLALPGEPALARIDAAKLEPIFQVLKDPGSLRSLTLTHVDAKKVDAVVLRRGQEELKLVHPEGGDWQLQTAADKLSKANDKACQDLVEVLQGKKQIQSFPEQSDAELGLDKPVAEVSLYSEALEKDAKDKKDKKKVTWKKDVKPAVTLSFGKTDKEVVYVKRVTQDGLTSKLAVPKSLLDKAAPPQWSLAFLDLALPTFAVEDVIQLALERGKDKVEVVRGQGEDAARWLLKNLQDLSGRNHADNQLVPGVLGELARLQARKWLKKTEAKEDLEVYGLKTPTLVATVYVRKDRPAVIAAGVALLLTVPAPQRALAAVCALALAKSTDQGDPLVIKVGKETDQEKDKPGVFALHSGSELLFLLPTDLVKGLREVDLRDRSWVLKLQPLADASLLAANNPPGPNLLPLASPLVTGNVLTFDAAKVKEVKAAIRTKQELRRLHFLRPKDAKTWQDKSGLEDFHLDADKVTELVDSLSKLRTDRFVLFAGGPKAEHKFGPKEASLKIDLVREDGKTFTLTVGAAFEGSGYFAHSSAWPQAVFLLPPAQIDPLLRGVPHFAKEKVAGLP